MNRSVPLTDLKRLRPRRGGLASAVVLVVLFVIALISVALVKVAFARRAEVAREERRVQAGWLAESGVDRAVARLDVSADYAGETWRIPADELGGRGEAEVAIRVEKLPDRPDRRRVRIEADYPIRSNQKSRQSREVIVALPSPSR